MLDSEIVFIFIFIFLTDNKAKFQNQIKFFMKCKCWGLVCLRGFVFFSPYICEREVFSNIVMNDLIIAKLKWKYFLIYTKIQIFQRLRGEQRMVWILFPHCTQWQTQKPQLLADRAIPHKWGGKREDQVHLAEGGQTESWYAPGQPLVPGAGRPRPCSLPGSLAAEAWGHGRAGPQGLGVVTLSVAGGPVPGPSLGSLRAPLAAWRINT